MYAEENRNLKKLQQLEIDILKNVVKICEENHIRYFALDGTLLGAVRHQNMIPWDDDIDIGMPRKDYEKFLSIADNCLEGKFKLLTDTSNEIYTAKVITADTKVRLNMAKFPVITNVWIDIFPLDGMPEKYGMQILHKFLLLFARLMVQLSVLEQQVHLYRENRPIYEKFLLKFFMVTKFGRNIDTYKWKKTVQKLLKKYDYDSSETIVNFWSAYKFREMFPKKVYGMGRKAAFADLRITIPVYAETVLEKLYGFYRDIPAPDKRFSQHKIEIIKL